MFDLHSCLLSSWENVRISTDSKITFLNCLIPDDIPFYHRKNWVFHDDRFNFPDNERGLNADYCNWKPPSKSRTCHDKSPVSFYAGTRLLCTARVVTLVSRNFLTLNCKLADQIKRQSFQRKTCKKMGSEVNATEHGTVVITAASLSPFLFHLRQSYEHGPVEGSSNEFYRKATSESCLSVHCILLFCPKVFACSVDLWSVVLSPTFSSRRPPSAPSTTLSRFHVVLS